MTRSPGREVPAAAGNRGGAGRAQRAGRRQRPGRGAVHGSLRAIVRPRRAARRECQPRILSVGDVRSLPQAQRIVAASGRANAGILIDPLHFSRSGATSTSLPPCPRNGCTTCSCAMRLRRARPPGRTDPPGPHRAAVPGEGGLDLQGLLQHLPRDLPVGIEAPTRARALTMAPVERARRAREATLDLLARLDAADRAGSNSLAATTH